MLKSSRRILEGVSLKEFSDMLGNLGGVSVSEVDALGVANLCRFRGFRFKGEVVFSYTEIHNFVDSLEAQLKAGNLQYADETFLAGVLDFAEVLGMGGE